MNSQFKDMLLLKVAAIRSIFIFAESEVGYYQTFGENFGY